jgi:hypothetical protein
MPTPGEGTKCPDCGGSEYRVISPGLHECRHEIVWYEKQLVDDPGVYFAYGRPGMKSVDVRRSRVCGHRYEEDAPTMGTLCRAHADGQTCGAFAVGMCADCTTPVCRYHSEFKHDRLLCRKCLSEADRAAREAQAQAEAEAAQTQAREAELYQAQARADCDRYEELTPGFPYPPTPPGQVLTYQDLMTKDWYLSSNLSSAQALCRSLSALVPSRTTRITVVPRNGLLSLARHETGWSFTERHPGEDIYHPLDPVDVLTHWLITTQGQFWEHHQKIDRGRPTPAAAWRYDHVTHGQVGWETVQVVRAQVLRWLGRQG